ncbi:MAG TPA: shikimate dehydrogenase, partial [Thermoleophilia bacterium]
MSHSLSPQLHNAAFQACGLDMVYVPLPVRAHGVGAAVQGLAALGFRGANVTIPHKGAVVPYLSWLDDDARAVAAVNTIVVAAGELRGYNTDVEGVRG